MNKRLCIALFAFLLVVPTMAQQAGDGKRDASFAPRKGQWEISAHMGNSQMFNQNISYYLLPTYYDGKSFWHPVGLPNEKINQDINILVGNQDVKTIQDAKTNQSADPGMYLNLNSLENNSLVNLIGLQAKYFITDNIDINLMFNMNIQMTPAKDFIEGDSTVLRLPIQQSQYMEGRLTNVWSVGVGSNYYFNTRNERINLYVGGTLGWQMGTIQTNLPYTGETVDDDEIENDIDPEDNAGDDGDLKLGNDDKEILGDILRDPIEMYVPNSRAGQIMALKAAATAGIEYSVAKGLVLGFEVQPISYVGSFIRICPKAATKYSTSHHQLGFLAAPRFRIAFRF